MHDLLNDRIAVTTVVYIFYEGASALGPGHHIISHSFVATIYRAVRQRVFLILRFQITVVWTLFAE